MTMMSTNSNTNRSALDVLMNSAKKSGGTNRKRPISYVPCPSCGAQVAERDINDHLDRCLMSSSDGNGGAASSPGVGDASSPDVGDSGKFPTQAASGTDANGILAYNAETSEHEPITKRGRISSPSPRRPPPPPPQHVVRTPPVASSQNNAFSHMMKRSAAVFSKSDNVVRHRFHLHNAEGLVTWHSEDEIIENQNNDNDSSLKKGAGDNSTNDLTNSKSPNPINVCAEAPSVDEIHWSAVITMKKVQSAAMCDDPSKQQQGSIDSNDKSLELTISSSLPFPQDTKKQYLVSRHSRLSVSHLKSCLQKSVRRRAPLPSVRVAMELADKSWGDLIRRLPIIVLEDSSLHPDFGLLVWLMVAESKGYFPCMPLLKRVMQIVFEVASCPRQDVLSQNESFQESDEHKLPTHLSLKTPTAELFPEQISPERKSINSFEVQVRSMLLRAQYGGMKCDVRMLHMFAVRWLKRFRSVSVPTSLACFAPENTTEPINWVDLPEILHDKASQKSKELVTSTLVCPGGLLKLSITDVSSAGIDFHCSPVVEYLLSQREMYTSLCERLTQSTKGNGVADKDWISGKLKSMIWDCSSGINHRRPLFETDENDGEGSILKAAWDDIVKTSFNDYTKKFVRNRLA